MCFPGCDLKINLRRIKQNKNIRLLTLTKITDVKGEAGNYTVSIKTSPRYVNENCTACGECANVVEAKCDDEFHLNLKKCKGAYLPMIMAQQ